LPSDGRTLYVKLYSMIGTVWYSQSYVYQAPFIAAVPSVITSVTTGNTVLASGSGTFADGPAVFSWNQGVLVTAYWLAVGSAPGKSDIYNASEGTKLSQSVTVPKDGRKLYVTLYSQIKGAWVTGAYTYTAFTAQAQILTVNGVSQTTGSLPAGSVTFAWSKGTDLSNPALGNYWLSIGTTAGGGNLYSKQLVGTSATIPNLPQNGQALYVTLYTNVGGQWLTSSYAYTAF
jgi:hypothetical protein